jgi:hypothetical protein
MSMPTWADRVVSVKYPRYASSSVGLVYDCRELLQVTTARPRVAGGATSRLYGMTAWASGFVSGWKRRCLGGSS